MAAYSEDQLIHALAAAASPNQLERDAAFRYLSELSPQSAFQWHLVQACSTHALPWEVRLQAILFFKNGLHKYWRRTGNHSVSVEHKALIRPRLLQMVHEQDSKVANVVAECIARIARLDYDRDWPDLFSTLLTSIEHAIHAITANPGDLQARLVLDRALLYWHEATKVLSQNKMLRGKQIMGSLCESAMPLLIQLYRLLFSAACSALEASPLIEIDRNTPSESGLALLTLKILNKLIVHGWGGSGLAGQEAKTAFESQQADFFVSTVNDLSTIVSLRKAAVLEGRMAALSAEGNVVASTNRLMTRYVRFARSLLMQNHRVFHRLGVTQRLCDVCWGCVAEAAEDISVNMSDDERCLFPEKFIIKSLLLVKCCFSQYPVADPSIKSSDFAIRAAQLITHRILPLRPKDLARWQDEPEEFFLEEEAEQNPSQWKFDLRPAAEAFLQDLLQTSSDESYRSVIIPSILEAKARLQSANGTEQVLQKEAIYTACGLSPTAMSEYLDFGQWMRDSLLGEAGTSDQGSLIIRRRIAWLMGRWLNEDSSPEGQGQCYSVMCHLMGRNDSTDLVTRLTAAQALTAMETWVEDSAALVPFIAPVLQCLADLIRDTESAEIHLRLNKTLAAVVQRAGSGIAVHLDLCMQIVPVLWHSAEAGSGAEQFKSDLVLTLAGLVNALQTGSQSLHATVCPFIEMSCNPAHANHIYMQDNGLSLWRSMLRYAESASPDLLQLAPLAVTLLDGDGDSTKLEVILRVVEGYSVLAPEVFLPPHATLIFARIAHHLDRLDEAKAARPLMRVVDMVIACSSTSTWATALGESGLFSRIMVTLQSDASATVVTRYLCTLARVAIADHDILLQLLRHTAEVNGLLYEDLLTKLIAQWLNRYDNQSHSSARKLVALALTSVVRSTEPIILERLDEIMGVWLSALSETKESAMGESVHSTFDNVAVDSCAWVPAVSERYSCEPPPTQDSGYASATSECGWTGDSNSLDWTSVDQTSPSSRASPLDDDDPPSPSIRNVDYAWWQHQNLTYNETPSRPRVSVGHPGTFFSSHTRSDAFLSGGFTAGTPRLDDHWPNVIEPVTDFSNFSATTHFSTGSSDNSALDASDQSGETLHADNSVNNDNTVNFTNDHNDDDDAAWGIFHVPTNANNSHNSDDTSHCSADTYYEEDWRIDGEVEDAGGLGWEGTLVCKSPEAQRSAELLKHDPVHCINTTHAITQAMHDAGNLNGGAAAFEQRWLASIDIKVLAELNDYLSGRAVGGD